MRTTSPASSGNLRAPVSRDAPPAAAHRFQSLDLLPTLVAVVGSDGAVLFANSALEDALGISRRAIEGSNFPHSFTEPQKLQSAREGAGSNEFSALRYNTWHVRKNKGEPLLVHAIVAQTDKPGEI